MSDRVSDRIDQLNGSIDGLSYIEGPEENTHEFKASVNKGSISRKSPFIAPYKDLEIFLNQIGKFQRMSDETLAEKVRDYQYHGDIEAGDEVVNANLRLATYFAKRYISCSRLNILDIIQICNMSLMETIGEFDPDKGSKFSSYAIYKMRNRVNRAINEIGYTIRIPEWLHIFAAKFKKTAFKLKGELGREPDLTEIAVKMGMTVEKLQSDLKNCLFNIGSLDEPIFASATGSSEVTYGEMLNSRTLSPYDLLHAKEVLQRRYKRMQQIFACIGESVSKAYSNRNLIERNVYIMMERYGLNDETLTLKGDIEVAECVSGRYQQRIIRQTVTHVRNKTRAAMPEQYSKINDEWIETQLSRIDDLIEITELDRSQLIHNLRRANRLF